MKKIIGEFKEFIMRGNVLDLAVGVTEKQKSDSQIFSFFCKL